MSIQKSYLGNFYVQRQNGEDLGLRWGTYKCVLKALQQLPHHAEANRVTSQ